MSKTVNKLTEAINNSSLKDIETKIARSARYVDRFYIIEGRTDAVFYSNIRNINSCGITEYVYNRNQGDEKGGKDSVIRGYKTIHSKEEYKKLIPKCIFIIDHDYDGLSRIEEIDKNKFSITKRYSFENYFLDSKNINIIFKHFNLTDYDIEQFENKYNKFLNQIKEYIRLKASTIVVKIEGHEYYDRDAWYYKVKYSPNVIFKFNFKREEIFEIDKMYEENNKMKIHINYPNNRKMKEFYEEKSKDFIKREFIRGHNAYDFLIEYLSQIHNINCKIEFKDEKYDEIVKKLDVDIDIKNYLGNIIN